MAEQGWYHDPYHEHEDRYFSDGQPTKLVRDGETEAYEEPPAEPVPEMPKPVETVETTQGSDLLRSDGAQAEALPDPAVVAEAVMDAGVAGGPTTV